MINPGTTPKEITSQSESNCFPISEVTFSARATIPSILSKNTPTNTQTSVIYEFPSTTEISAKQPESPFSSVSMFGIDLMIFVIKVLVKRTQTYTIIVISPHAKENFCCPIVWNSIGVFMAYLGFCPIPFYCICSVIVATTLEQINFFLGIFRMYFPRIFYLECDNYVVVVELHRFWNVFRHAYQLLTHDTSCGVLATC